MSASQLSAGPGDVCDGAGRLEGAELLDLRAGVPNVTCVRDKEITSSGSFSTPSAPRLAISLCLARVSAKWDAVP